MMCTLQMAEDVIPHRKDVTSRRNTVAINQTRFWHRAGRRQWEENDDFCI